MAGSIFDGPTFGIGRLLSEGGRFVVPSHQRDYSWTEDEIEQLFADIEEARSARQNDYFIGLMVFMPREGTDFIILDGQQRLATVVIILASIRTWLKKHGLDKDAEQIQSTYIASRELGEEDLEPRIILNENNNNTFVRFVIREEPSEDVEAELGTLRRYDPNRRLLDSILFCRDKLEEIASRDQGSTQDRAKRLFDLVRYLRDGVKIVRLTVPNEANAYTVFETLNYRGLDLSVLDLVKNYLFGKADAATGFREVQSRWAQMMANLTSVRADDFMKAYWTSRYGRIQTAQLFQSFKTKVNSWRKVSEASNDMLSASEQFAALEIADDPVWAGLSERTRQRIRALKVLGSQQVHPALLSALVKFSQRELERLLHLLEILIVRYQLISGSRTGRLEIACAALAVGIYQEKIKTATEAFHSLKDIFPTDEEFRDAFMVKQERNNRKAHYILETLEWQARQARAGGVSASELQPSVSLTVEHVLPRNPDPEWDVVLDQDDTIMDDCTYRIGNLCLLSGMNKDLANKSFAKKHDSYAQSDLLLTREVASFSEWDRKSIEKRQEKMAALAVAAWRFQ